jgi:hypothetical protein
MLTKEQWSRWFDWFDRRLLWFDRRLLSLSKYTNRLSKAPLPAMTGRFDIGNGYAAALNDRRQFISILCRSPPKCNSIHDPVVNRALMFCFLKRLDGRFVMELCLRKFAKHYRDLFNEDDLAFLERQGKMLFLSYLAPLLNGDGFYHLESQFANLRRMDIIVDYSREQFIIELKIWHGEEARTARLTNSLPAIYGARGRRKATSLRLTCGKARIVSHGKRGSMWETCASLT